MMTEEIDNESLTKALADASVTVLASFAAIESARTPPRPYVVERIMRRLQRRIADKLYELPMTEMVRKGESPDKYIRRLYDIALKG